MIVARIGAILAAVLLALACFKDFRAYGSPGWMQAEFNLFVTFLLAIALFATAALAGNIAGDYAVAVRRGLNAGDDILRQASVAAYVAVAGLTAATVLWIVLR